jgi:hypothetical protein
VHARHPRAVVDRLPARQTNLVVYLLLGQAFGVGARRRKIDADVVGIEKPFGHRPRPVTTGARAEKQDCRREGGDGATTTATGRRQRLRKSASNCARASGVRCAFGVPRAAGPGLASGAAAAARGLVAGWKYSQKFARSLASTRSAWGSRHEL